jgi:hypothetical protein
MRAPVRGRNGGPRHVALFGTPGVAAIAALFLLILVDPARAERGPSAPTPRVPAIHTTEHCRAGIELLSKKENCVKYSPQRGAPGTTVTIAGTGRALHPIVSVCQQNGLNKIRIGFSRDFSMEGVGEPIALAAVTLVDRATGRFRVPSLATGDYMPIFSCGQFAGQAPPLFRVLAGPPGTDAVAAGPAREGPVLALLALFVCAFAGGIAWLRTPASW